MAELAKKDSIPLHRRVAYGTGDSGFQLYFSITSLFLLYFYTDILGLSGTAGGMIILIALIWDGISDPIMGYIAERTKSRWGSYRPYILFGMLPLAVSLMLMFYNPGFEGAALIAYAAATHVLFRTFYTVLSIPYGSLAARMTQDGNMRNQLAAFRMFFATMGAIFVAVMTLKLVAYFGQGDQAKGFFYTATLYALMSLPIFFFLFATAREPDVYDVPSQGWGGLKDAISAMFRNPAFLIVFTAAVLGSASYIIGSKMIIYYYKYNLGDEEAAGTALGVLTLVVSIFIPIWAFIASKTSKRLVWLIGLAISATNSILLYFNTYETIPVVTALFALGSIGTASSILSLFSILPDTIEYGELQTGIRNESMVYGFLSLAQKIAIGVGAGLVGILLDSISYQPNVVQSAETLQGIKNIVTLIPAGLAILGFLVVWQYPKAPDHHARIVAILEKRRARKKPSI